VVGRCDGKERILYSTKIQGKKQFNSWFYIGFGKDIFLPKNSTCLFKIYVKKEAEYQSFELNNVSFYNQIFGRLSVKSEISNKPFGAVEDDERNNPVRKMQSRSQMCIIKSVSYSIFYKI